MARTIVACAALACILLVTACHDDDDDDGADAGPVVLESASLFRNSFGGCDVRGTVFNTDGDDHCDVFLEFDAFDSFGTRFAEAFDDVDGIPPNTRAAYRATFFDANGDSPPCEFIDDFELFNLGAFCGN